MKHNILVVLALLCLAVPGTAAAAIYKWVDANGVVTFRDTPPPAGGQVRNVEVRPDPPRPPAVDLAPAGNAPPPAEVASEAKPVAPAPQPPAYTNAKVEIYTTSWCPYCIKAEAFFRERGIPFTAYDIEKDADAARRKDQLDGQKGVPFAIINGRKVHGFSAAAYQQALDAKE